MKNFLNYVGQLRIYSLVDLVLLVVAIHAQSFVGVGIIFLHLGFLAFLETRHEHSYRKKIPQWVYVVLGSIGVILYWHWEVIPFLICSYLYTKKNNGYFGATSSLFRGLQYFFLVAGVVGYMTPFPWVALLVLFVRNFAGDLRDIVKDTKEGMKTLPIIIGLKHDMKYVHLITVLFTSLIWWQQTTLSFILLCIVFGVEIVTYNSTPR